MAATDILTVTEAEAALHGVPGISAENSLQVELYNSAVSQMIDAACGPVVQRTVTAELQPTNGDWCIETNYPLIVSASSVVEYDSNGATTTLSAEDHDTKPADGYLIQTGVHWPRRIYRRTGGSPARFPHWGNVVLTYTAGRYASTSAVTAQFKLAAQITLAHIWKIEKGMGNAPIGAVEDTGFTPIGFALPNRARELVSREIEPVVA